MHSLVELCLFSCLFVFFIRASLYEPGQPGWLEIPLVTLFLVKNLDEFI